MERYQDIFDFIIRQETSYAKHIKLPTGKMWSMKDHINRSALYRDSDIVGEKDKFTPIKNITRPILNLQYRTEDIDVKDVQLYVDDSAKYHLSFLVKKYHDDVFVVEHDLDTYFDQLNQSRVDFGAGLSKSLSSPLPETVPLQSIAFCDQRDILSRPIGLKHSYSPDELMGMASKGWGDSSKGATASLRDVIRLSRENPRDGVSEGDIEIYEVHGNVPKRFATPSDDSEEYETRLFICCFYQKKDSMEKTGITLYSALETESPFKLVKRDPIYGRALGFGGAEELYEAQVWITYAMIRELHMLDSASKTILKASGAASATIANKNNINNLENNQIIDVGEGDLSQVDTFPRNIKLFDNSVAAWETHAQQMGAANDSIMGEKPSAGTPFKLQELVTAESHGLHDYRRGQFAKHLEEIYRDWIIPHIEKKICQGATFLSELSLEELQYVTEALVTNEANRMIKSMVLSGEDVTPEMVEEHKLKVAENFKKKGTKHFIEILKGEFKGATLGVKINIAGKQKNLAARVDKLTNIVRTVMAAPQLLSTPAMANIFNQIIEASGLDPVDFSNFEVPPPPEAAQPPQTPPQPLALSVGARANG